MRLLHRWSPG